MTLAAHEFIRRFLLHVLPSGFHRTRHYGFLAGPRRAATIDCLRDLIAASDPTARPRPEADASGAAPFAPEPMAATNVARLLASEMPASADRPIPGPSDALASSANALLQPSGAAPPSAKSP